MPTFLKVRFVVATVFVNVIVLCLALWIAQEGVGRCNGSELRRRFFAFVGRCLGQTIGMEFASQFPVRPFDGGLCGIAGHLQGLVWIGDY